MSDHHILSNRRSLKVVAAFLIVLLLLARFAYGQIQGADRRQGVLQGSIHLQSSQTSPSDIAEKIQPGTSVKLTVTVENKGLQENPAGQLYVRYAFSHPLESEVGSVIFETEKKPLPTIAPGKSIEISFDTPHQVPSVLDFVRHDWSLREYQAIAVINGSSHMIGTLAITFSAYYYPGIKKEFPVKVAN